MSKSQSRRPRRRRGACVFLFFLCFFLLFSSGRIDSIDPKAELQAATSWALTGRLGVHESPMPALPNLWVQNAAGDYYEAHDIGAVVFLLPAASVGALATHRPAAAQIEEPSWEGRFAVAVSYVALSAAGCLFLFQMFAGMYPARTAFLLTLAFATATIFWAYTKSAYDVMGACVGVCLLLRCCADALRAPRVTGRQAVGIGLAFVVACSFRFSLAPALVLGLLALLVPLRRTLGRRSVALGAAVILAGMAPSFWYNALRTAAPLRTAATGHYAPSTALQGHALDGLWGLVLSPNRGLLWFAPVFALLLGLPFVWRRVPATGRALLLCFGVTAAAYLALIAKLNFWAGVGGWGPRYVVPILPILFLGVGVVLAAWERHKAWPRALLLLSVVLNAVPVLVNYSLAQAPDAAATDPYAPRPAQQTAAWRGLRLGLEGRPLPAPPAVAGDPVRRFARDFPDFWTAHLIAYSRAGAFAGTAAALAMGGLGLWSLAGALRREEERPEEDPGEDDGKTK